MTAAEVIRRALRMIGVLDAAETPEAEDVEDALDILRALFAEWRGMDLMVPDYAVPSPATELTIDLADREAVAYQLALRLAPDYGAQLSPEAREAREESWRRFQMRYFQPGPVDLSELPVATGAYHSYCIDHD